MSVQKVGFVDFQQNYHDWCKKCRDTGDILKLDVSGDTNIYVVADHAGVNRVLRNYEGHLVHFADFFEKMEKATELDKKIGDIFAKNLGNNSGMHLELRKDIRNHFNGGGVDQHIGFIIKTIQDLVPTLEGIAAKNDGVVDITKDFAMPLTFLVTAHMIGLDFNSEEEKEKATEWAADAIRLVNLMAPEEVKIKALEGHDKLSALILPQLKAYVDDTEGVKRKDCLFYDFAQKLRLESESGLWENYIELVNGLFQAGLGATGNFIAMCLNLVLSGDENNSAEDIKSYYLDPARTDEEKREAVAEYIRVTQAKLGGFLPRYTETGGPFMGNEIEPNSLVYMSFVSANFDEKAFKEPYKVNPDRIKTPPGLTPEQLKERKAKRIEKNVSFSFGEHMCPGRRIALTIIRHVMDELFALYPDMEAVEIDIFSEIMGKPSEVKSFKIKLNK